MTTGPLEEEGDVSGGDGEAGTEQPSDQSESESENIDGFGSQIATRRETIT